MKLKADEGKTIFFYKTKMVFKTMLEETDQAYSTILMTHPPSVGPALHLHPEGPETFFIVEGDYTFTLDGSVLEASKGDFICIPKNTPHTYKTGSRGGQVLVTTPRSVEIYFLHIAEKLTKGEVSLAYEFEFAMQNGQTFLDTSDHWAN